MLRVLAAALLLATPAAAQLYTEAELQRVMDRSVPTIREVFEEDIVGNLPREMRPRAAQVRLAFPERGPSPLAFYADPETQTIFMPLESIRFFDDLSLLFPWVEAHGCAPDAIQAYLWARLSQGQPLPSPLRAFGIDREAALDDPFAGPLRNGIFSSGLQFILAHELGHLMLDHEAGLAGPESQRQETEADAFALDHFERFGALPFGIFIYFFAGWWVDPTGTEARDAGSHPVSTARILAFARRIKADPMAFSHGDIDPAREAGLAASLAAQLEEFARLIDDDQFKTLMPQLLERDWPASRLPSACPPP